MIKLFEAFNDDYLNTFPYNSEIDLDSFYSLLLNTRVSVRNRYIFPSFFTDRDITELTNITYSKGINLSTKYIKIRGNRAYVYTIGDDNDWILKLEDEWYICICRKADPHKYYKLDQLDDLLKFIEHHD